MNQVSGFVQAHNEQYPGTMYERSVDELVDLFHKGHGVTLVKEGEVAYFGLTQPKFTETERSLLGGFQVVEMANSIVNPAFRGGGIGRIGNEARLTQIHRKWGDDSVAYLTTENRVNARVFRGRGEQPTLMDPVDWSDNPYMAGLTCAYSATGADTSHACDTKRRPREGSRPHDFDTMYDVAGDKILMSCTLLVSSQEAADKFGAAARSLHEELGGEPVYIDDDTTLTTQDVLRVDAFYQSLHQYAQQSL